MKDVLGQRGEALFYVMISKFNNHVQPLFIPQFLGDKYPSIDFMVELVNYTGKMIPYFLVQVKTTRRGYTSNNRLKLQVHKDDILRLSLFPAPTYLVGIDDLKEIGYVVSANGEYLKTVSNISTQFLLKIQIPRRCFGKKSKTFGKNRGRVTFTQN